MLRIGGERQYENDTNPLCYGTPCVKNLVEINLCDGCLF